MFKKIQSADYQVVLDQYQPQTTTIKARVTISPTRGSEMKRTFSGNTEDSPKTQRTYLLVGPPHFKPTLGIINMKLLR